MIDTNEIRKAFIKPYNGNPKDTEIIAEEMVISDICNTVDYLREQLTTAKQDVAGIELKIDALYKERAILREALKDALEYVQKQEPSTAEDILIRALGGNPDE